MMDETKHASKVYISSTIKTDYVIWHQQLNHCTPSRPSEISMKNCRAKAKQVLTHHLWYKAMLEVWGKSDLPAPTIFFILHKWLHLCPPIFHAYYWWSRVCDCTSTNFDHQSFIHLYKTFPENWDSKAPSAGTLWAYLETTV